MTAPAVRPEPVTGGFRVLPRIVHLSCYVDPDGREPEALLDAWPTLLHVAHAAAEAGLDVAIVQASGRDALIERWGIDCHFVDVGPVHALRGARAQWAAPLPAAIAHCVAALRPALVHLHGLAFPVQTRALGHAVPGVPVLVQDHADRPPPSWRRAIYRRGLACIDGVAFTARAQALPFVTAGVLRGDLPVFEVLESSSGFTPGSQTAARAATGLSGDPCLLWVGRLDANKDPLTVLEALGRAAHRLPDARLWCCYTDAPLLDEIRDRLVADPALAARVRLLGRVPHAQVEVLCRAADLFVLGSHQEGSGFALLEALACGTTPIVTDIPAFRRITRSGAVGALVALGDAEAMADAIVTLARRDRTTLRAAARAHFVRHLSFAALGAELRAAYAALGGC